MHRSSIHDVALLASNETFSIESKRLDCLAIQTKLRLFE